MSQNQIANFRVGDRVWWNFTTRGGYGYHVRAAGVVVSTGRSRVRVRVMRRRGDDWVAEEKSLRPESLVDRQEIVDVVDNGPPLEIQGVYRTPYEPSGLFRVLEIEPQGNGHGATARGVFVGDHPAGYPDGSPGRYFVKELVGRKVEP